MDSLNHHHYYYYVYYYSSQSKFYAYHEELRDQLVDCFGDMRERLGWKADDPRCLRDG